MKGGQRWISPPGRKYEKDGEQKWYSHVRFDNDAIRERFQKAVMDLLPLKAEEPAKTDDEQLPF